eukprot:3413068-Rhodomonas_salina.1
MTEERSGDTYWWLPATGQVSWTPPLLQDPPSTLAAPLPADSLAPPSRTPAGPPTRGASIRALQPLPPRVKHVGEPTLGEVTEAGSRGQAERVEGAGETEARVERRAEEGQGSESKDEEREAKAAGASTGAAAMAVGQSAGGDVEKKEEEEQQQEQQQQEQQEQQEQR